MLNRIALLLLLVCTPFFVKADPPTAPKEGMWIPLLLDHLNIEDMQAMGLKLEAEDIYSINKSSLKDAIVHFGGGCTSSIISPDGLLLTNHHCGYSRIQSHSSVDSDYLTDGFWAETKADELSNPGLSATLIVRIEDVTDQVLEGVTNDMSTRERELLVATNMRAIEAEAVEGTHYEAFIRPFYYGNEYYMMVTETFRDVRLVGAPPSSIGKFGGDMDNWMWPRHTGDFALFRIYADENNQPAEYSPDNVPYQPKYHLKISLDGVEEGDFTMVFGFPGRTQQYLTSYAVEHIVDVSDPAKIAIREIRLDVMDKYMRANDTVRIAYAAKQSSVSNAYKKWQGEIRGLEKANAVENKIAEEQAFEAWARNQSGTGYETLLTSYEQIYNDYNRYALARDYINEAIFGSEILAYAYGFRNLVAMSDTEDPDEEAIAAEVEKLKRGAEGFFKNYHRPLDREIFPQLVQAYADGVDPGLLPQYVKDIQQKYKGDYERYADRVFDKSIFDTKAELVDFLDDYEAKDVKKLNQDPAYSLMSAVLTHYFTELGPVTSTYDVQLDSLNRLYMQAQREFSTNEVLYPDANSTMRIAYGKVEPYEPIDGIVYTHYTTLEGVMDKATTGHPDYEVPERLLSLYRNKDYGRYAADDGTLRLNFIASNHTTGGNSGSPVLNGEGELIGLNFDRNWEGTMSDINYNPDQVRNISVDIRYVVFVVDKFAGAKHLVQEMTLVD